jgi:hypothetical protein
MILDIISAHPKKDKYCCACLLLFRLFTLTGHGHLLILGKKQAVAGQPVLPSYGF